MVAFLFFLLVAVDLAVFFSLDALLFLNWILFCGGAASLLFLILLASQLCNFKSFDVFVIFHFLAAELATYDLLIGVVFCS
jgi:hypothetical protein